MLLALRWARSGHARRHTAQCSGTQPRHLLACLLFGWVCALTSCTVRQPVDVTHESDLRRFDDRHISVVGVLAGLDGRNALRIDGEAVSINLDQASRFRLDGFSDGELVRVIGTLDVREIPEAQAAEIGEWNSLITDPRTGQMLIHDYDAGPASRVPNERGFSPFGKQLRPVYFTSVDEPILDFVLAIDSVERWPSLDGE